MNWVVKSNGAILGANLGKYKSVACSRKFPDNASSRAAAASKSGSSNARCPTTPKYARTFDV